MTTTEARERLKQAIIDLAHHKPIGTQMQISQERRQLWESIDFCIDKLLRCALEENTK